MDTNTRHNLNKAVDAAKIVRDALFSASQEAMTSNEGDFGAVQLYFEASKKAEILRREITDLLAKSAGAVAETQASTAETSETKKERNHYPKYVFRDGRVIRIGLSRNGSEYEHTVKRPDFDVIVEAINRFSDGSEFSVDNVQKHLSVPVYQTYAVVSLMTEQVGLLESRKRGAYKFKTPGRVSAQGIIEKL